MFGFNKKKKMDENEFWNIIEIFDWENEGDDEKVTSEAMNYLSKKSNEEIFEFYEILSKHLYDLDGIEYARNIGEESYSDDSSRFSADWFLYTRCVVVANGRDFYYEVLGDPTRMPKDLEFESLLYIACDAFEKKNGDVFDYVAKYDFETFSNKDKWKE